MLEQKPARRRLAWSQLAKAQLEDEEMLRHAGKQRMKWLSRSRDINRTSFSALKVDVALHVMCMPTVNQLMLRRHGLWE